MMNLNPYQIFQADKFLVSNNLRKQKILEKYGKTNCHINDKRKVHVDFAKTKQKKTQQQL